MEISTAEVVLRVLLAAGLGTLVGIERQWRSQPAGARTHALVAAGAALFTLAGAYGFPELTRGSNVDPMRVAAQVASGIGFIGAGAILREGLSVRGLTTAASLWASAALGVASGAGFLRGALVGFGIVLLVLLALRAVRDAVLSRAPGHRPEVDLAVDYTRGRGTMAFLLGELERRGSQVEHLRIEDDGERTDPGVRHVHVHVRAGDQAELERLAQALAALPEVQGVRIDERANERSRA